MLPSLKQWATQSLDVPKLEQKRSGYCGPAALRMTLEHFGISASEGQIASAAGASEEQGTALQGMVAAAAAFGLRAEVRLGATMQDLQQALGEGAVPIVAWWSEDDGHYSTVTAVQPDGTITINDPETGEARTFEPGAFDPIWHDFDGPSQTNPIDHAAVIVRGSDGH